MMRMKKTLLHIVSFCLLLLLFSCMKEDGISGGLHGIREGDPIDLVLSFGAPQGDSFYIDTKSDMGMQSESKIWNLYVFLFDDSNNKFYGQYFDSINKGNTSLSDYWYVTNLGDATNSGTASNTTGEVHMHTMAKENPITVVAIANIDSSIMNVSPEQLNSISNLAQLNNLIATLNQPIVERTGYFPMSGIKSGVSMSQGGDFVINSEPISLKLVRMDAKIIFRIHAAGHEGGSAIKSFTPDRWEAYNLPNKCYVIERAANAVNHDAAVNPPTDPAPDFFNTDPANYHSESVLENLHYEGDDGAASENNVLQHEFVFYMMENRRTAAATPTCFEDRDRKIRPALGSEEELATRIGNSSNITNGDFQYAPALGTYIKFGGFIEMAVPSGQPLAGATLSANAEYIVHLGDFGTDLDDPRNLDDFSIERNHTYIYDITIYDAESIKVEVEENHDPWVSNNLREDEPGATGLVTVSREEIYECDAHYSSHVITFHLDNMIGQDAEGHEYVEDLTWFVRTPFNPEGASPRIVELPGGETVEDYTGLDYKWVEFRVNDIDPATHAYYDQKRQIYKPMTGSWSDGKTMTIDQLVIYLKKQAQLAIDHSDACMFDNPVPEASDPRRKICVTAFVNEYYYEKDIDGGFDPDLWKRVVNQPMRYMHILSGTQKSADGESRAITASFTIRQKSIQSIYNVDHDGLTSAWGSEHTDDDSEMGTHQYGGGFGDPDNRGNTSLTNGWMNTLKEWGLVDKNDKVYQNRLNYTITRHPAIPVDEDLASELASAPARAKWGEYVNLTAMNYISEDSHEATQLMNPTYQYLRFSCMSRNRDNNGNGVIDLDEVRWYMGATNQLYGLFLGSYGIDGDAKLYQRNVMERASTTNDVWRQHVIASTRYTDKGATNSNTNPRVIWAEEGVTGSEPTSSFNFSGIDRFSTRCLRNLGISRIDQDITYAGQIANDKTVTGVEPQSYIQVKRIKNGEEYPSTAVIESTYPDYNYGNGAYKWDGDVSYEFDCSRVNKASIRYFWPKELDFTDEFDMAACLPEKFLVASKNANPKIVVADIPGLSKSNFEGINTYLNENIGDNPFCPPGYRLPNIRELVLLRYFLPETLTVIKDNFIGKGLNVICRTKWSFGVYGAHPKTGLSYGNGKQPSYTGWATTTDKIIMCKLNEHTTEYVRCVKDIDPSLP